MKKTKFLNLLLLGVLFLAISSCSKKIRIEEYSQKLKINFPPDMDLVFYDFKSDSQDYSSTSIYKLTFNQKNKLLNEIAQDLVDSEKGKQNLKWTKCNDYYSYEYQNKDVSIKVIFVAENNLSILTIREVKI